MRLVHSAHRREEPVSRYNVAIAFASAKCRRLRNLAVTRQRGSGDRVSWMEDPQHLLRAEARLSSVFTDVLALHRTEKCQSTWPPVPSFILVGPGLLCEWRPWPMFTQCPRN